MNYHPNYFNKYEKSHRNRSQLDKRLNHIREAVTSSDNMLDIGCESGYNSFGLMEYFNHIDSFDMVEDLIKRAEIIAGENDVNNISFKVSELNDYLNNNSDRYSVILYLSIHHHIIEKYGFEFANDMLSKISLRCQTQMFIDMGQKNEKNCQKHSWWNKLPSSNNVENWVKSYLEQCTFMRVENIGSTTIHGVSRYLWKLDRL